jgi:uncharacterized protein
MPKVEQLESKDEYKNNLKTLKLYISNKCNMDCTYCYVRKENTKTSLSLKDCLLGVDTLLNSKGEQKTIQFLGGEPLLEYKKVTDIMKYATSHSGGKQIDFILSTNGVLLDQRKVNFFYKYDSLIIISIDGSAKTHDLYRKMKGSDQSSYHIITENIRNINAGRERLMASYVFTPETINKALANIKNLVRIGFRMIDFQLDVNTFIDKQCLNDLRKFLNNFKKYYLEIFREGKREQIFSVPAINSLVREEFSFSSMWCDSFLLAPDKKYYSCGRLLGLSNDQRKPYSFGTASQGIDQGKRAVLLAKSREEIDILFRKCRRCGFQAQCFCKIATYLHCKAKRGDVKKSLDTICHYAKEYNGTMLHIIKNLQEEKNPYFKKIYNLK